MSDDLILDRTMIPMIFEGIRCLEDKIVASPMELDLAVIYGLGFPPFHGGLIKFAERVGLARLLELGQKYEVYGPMFSPPKLLEAKVKEGRGFYV